MPESDGLFLNKKTDKMNQISYSEEFALLIRQSR